MVQNFPKNLKKQLCRKSSTGRYRSFNSDILNYSGSEKGKNNFRREKEFKNENELEMRRQSSSLNSNSILQNSESENFENLSNTESARYRLKNALRSKSRPKHFFLSQLNPQMHSWDIC